jgi:hypothetical protein
MSSGERAARDESAKTNGPARFLSWNLVSQTPESPHTMDTLGPVQVAFRLEVNAPMRHVILGIALFNIDRHLIWAFNVDDVSLEPGQAELSFKFPYLPVRPGAYSWQLTLWNDEGNVDTWDSVPEMLVATENFQHTRDEWNGVMNLPCNFSLRRQSESSNTTVNRL